MNYYTSLRIVLFLWQIGWVDSLTAATFFANVGAQYAGIVSGTLIELTTAGKYSKLPLVLLEPFRGLAVSCRYVHAARTTSDMHARAATVAALLSASAALATSSSAVVNAGYCGTVSAEITRMRTLLATRGGAIALDQVKEAVKLELIKPPMLISEIKRAKYTETCTMIINNMFNEHTTRRYVQDCAKKVTPMTPLVTLTSTQLRLIGWTFIGLGVTSFLAFGGLYLFHLEERRRWQNQKHQNDEVLIDVVAEIL